MADRDQHKRSRSGLARAFLSRGRNDAAADESAIADNNANGGSAFTPVQNLGVGNNVGNSFSNATSGGSISTTGSGGSGGSGGSSVLGYGGPPPPSIVTPPTSSSPPERNSSRHRHHLHSASMSNLRNAMRRGASNSRGDNPFRSSSNLPQETLDEHHPLELEPSPGTQLSSSPPRRDGPGPTQVQQEQLPTRQDPAGRPSLSIDQSVRVFRLFEILKSGDPQAIAKAVSECAESEAEPLGTTILHLAIQVTQPHIVELILSYESQIDINARDRDGNTPLHLAAQLGRSTVVRDLLNRPAINDSAVNYAGQTPIDIARTPDVFQQLQLARSLFITAKVEEIRVLAATGNYSKLEALLVEPRVEGLLDINAEELVTDPTISSIGGTLLHEAARKRDSALIQLLLMHGADPFRRDRKGKLPQDVTKDDRTRAILKRSPAAVMAQRGIQERAILGNAGAPQGGRRNTAGEGVLGSNKDAREMKGYLKKWTNYTTGYKLRWFVLEDCVLSYYKHQDDTGSACRGAINMRIAKLDMDPQDKTRFSILGKSSVKYHLKANHVVEAKRWFWALNNAIQWAKDEAKEEDRRRNRDAEALRQAKMDVDRHELQSNQSDTNSQTKASSLAPPPLHTINNGSSSSNGNPPPSSSGSLQVPKVEEGSVTGDEDDGLSDMNQVSSHVTGMNDDDDDDSSRDVHPSTNRDAFNITAQSLRMQLELLTNLGAAFRALREKSPTMVVTDSTVEKAALAFSGTVSNLNALVVDLLKISKDRDAFWQYRLDREIEARRLWEDSMARVAHEHEQLQQQIDESEEKRKRTKKVLKGALGNVGVSSGRASMEESTIRISDAVEAVRELDRNDASPKPTDLQRRKSYVEQIAELSDDDSDKDEEFFDAADSGEVPVIQTPGVEKKEFPVGADDPHLNDLQASFRGYEPPLRRRLKLDYDNRPRISLWGILKSMIGKDMTKMTLPVSFNEPTSLLQRVAEDLEYTDLLDMAASRANSMERLVYIAAFAASEYASTIGRVAKPFNPLLGETFEYARPDKGYRFYIEQVSHHPPIGAAYADSPHWDYWGESAVKSKFYGKSFDINPLGTWFLRMRPHSGGEELYTWKKVTSSVIGIITGSPTVDNYGPMEIKNWTTGESCLLDFKPRGWKASSAYHVTGKVTDRNGSTKWSLGGRWNDRIYARHTPGYENNAVPGDDQSGEVQNSTDAQNTRAAITEDSNRAFLIWQCHERPTGIPFNLTPFVVTLNAITEELRQVLPPTDTRLRPDQRAMEDGEYDLAAEEKNRVEEKQRARRRQREAAGEEFEPQWFRRARHEITGDEYWQPNGDYWQCRHKQDWKRCENIF